jgi:hypothetical protein
MCAGKRILTKGKHLDVYRIDYDAEYRDSDIENDANCDMIKAPEVGDGGGSEALESKRSNPGIPVAPFDRLMTYY